MTLSRRRLVAGGLSAIGSIAILARPARAAQFAWKWGSDTPIDHPVSVRAIEAFGKIRAATGGLLDIRAYPNSQLGSDPAMLTQLRSGALEMAAYGGGILDTVVPVTSIESVAFAFPTLAVALTAMDGALGAYVRAQIKAAGIMVMDKVYENGFREFTTYPKPIRTVDDLQGLKLRVSPGKLRVDTFKSLGAAVTPIVPSELYTALQTHVVDGQETSLPLIETQRLNEVQRFCSLSHHMWAGYWNIVNMDKWNSLPPNVAAIASKYLNESAILERRDNELLTLSLADKLQRQGLQFNTVDVATFKSKLASTGYYTRWKDNFGSAAWALLEQYSGKLT